MPTPEHQLENALIEKLRGLKYEYRKDIRNRAALKQNFREKFEALNQVRLTDGEFPRLLEEIITPDVFTAARTLRERNSFTRDDGTPLNYTLVNIKDWCKNTFEVVNQLRINTDNSHHRYDVILLINGVPVAQIEQKTLCISPRRAMEQIVDYKKDLGNGYTRTRFCFLQLFIVSNRIETYYFANNNSRHFAFKPEENFLPVYLIISPPRTTRRSPNSTAFPRPFSSIARSVRSSPLRGAHRQRVKAPHYEPVSSKFGEDYCGLHPSNFDIGYILDTTSRSETLTSLRVRTLLKDNVEENTNTASFAYRLFSDNSQKFNLN
jgi:type I restriction enzyme, R subunit